MKITSQSYESLVLDEVIAPPSGIPTKSPKERTKKAVPIDFPMSSTRKICPITAGVKDNTDPELNPKHAANANKPPSECPTGRFTQMMKKTKVDMVLIMHKELNLPYLSANHAGMSRPGMDKQLNTVTSRYEFASEYPNVVA